MKILIAHHGTEEFRAILDARFPDDDICYVDDPETLGAALAAHQPEAVFSVKETGFPGKYHPQIVQCPSVRWLQVGGSGYEHVGEWDADRVTVTNCAGVLARYLAETVTGAMIALNNETFLYRKQQAAHTWRVNPWKPLVGQTILIVGLGAIGGWVAHNAKALGMNVIGVRRSNTPHPSVDRLVTPDQLTEVIGEADVISLHVRHTPETDKMFDDAMLRACKPDSIFINTARGKVVDEAALIQVLNEGHFKAAYLDVFEVEPLPEDSPLWDIENVYITPHSSDQVQKWPTIFANFFGDNLERYKRGGALENTV